MTSEEIFNKAARFGITKYALGKAVYGRRRVLNIYRVRIPTSAQEKELHRINDALNELIKAKEKNNGKSN